MLQEIGIVQALWRYPFKSMLGEKLKTASVTKKGLSADRRFALRERATHKLATARHYPQLLTYRATCDDETQTTTIEFPDGSRVSVDDPGLESHFSSVMSKAVTLEKAFGDRTPDGLFDDSHVHIVSERTLESLQEQRAESRFDPRRFRPNILITSYDEQTLIDRQIRIGTSVVVKVEKPCQRCVMTTMAQEDLPRDNEILRTVAQIAQNIVGIYGTIMTPGVINVGDSVVLLDDSGY